MKKNGPYKIISSREVYKNPWINVREDKVIHPKGDEGVFGVVTIDRGMSVLPIDEEGYVYLTKEFRYAVGKDTIETISGGVDKGEKIVEAVKREMLEEVGIKAKKFTELGMLYPLTTVLFHEAFLFLAEDLSFCKPDTTSKEIIQPVKIKLEKAMDMVCSSEIQHAPSCVLIYKAYHYINSIKHK